jgi:hypothetical protein
VSKLESLLILMLIRIEKGRSNEMYIYIVRVGHRKVFETDEVKETYRRVQ